MDTSMTGNLPAIVIPEMTTEPPVIVRPTTTAKPPRTAKPSTTQRTREEAARAARRARALRSKTVIAIYLVVTFGVGAALLEMRSRASAQSAAHAAPRRVASAPPVAAPAPVVEAPKARGPVAPAPPGAPAPWGGWIG